MSFLKMGPVHKTKAELALEGLRDAILRGDVEPGERLTLPQLSEALGMSATPIREALRALEAEGLVTSQPHRKFVVANLTAADAEEIYMLRAPMESLATRLAVPLLTAADLDRLERLQQEMAEAAAAYDDRGLTRANADWHLTLYTASGRRHLVRLILQLWMPFHWSGRWLGRRRAESLEEHARIMEAIDARDAETAARLMHEHITRVHLSIVPYLRAGGSLADLAATPPPPGSLPQGDEADGAELTFLLDGSPARERSPDEAGR